MKYVRYAVIAFWLAATLSLGIKTMHNPLVFRVILGLCLLVGSQIVGYFIREHLETVLRYAHKMWLGLIFVGLVLAFRTPTFADEPLPVPQAADEELSFNPQIPDGFTIKLPKPKFHKAAPGKGPLDIACEKHAAGDSKCACVNNAIFKHDSSWMTAGIGKKANNPCNMRPPKTWDPSVPMSIYQTKENGQFAKFKTKEDGIVACVELYNRFYRDMSASQLVSVWTDGGGNTAYRSQVASCF